MEPISYLWAPIRRWPVLVVVALVGLIVAALIPVSAGSAYPANTWQAASQVGLSPKYGGNKLGATLGVKQLTFYAHAPVVMKAAARADGVNYSPSLEADIVIGKARKAKGTATSGAHGAIVAISVLQPTRGRAASLTNAFVSALDAYAQVQLAAVAKKDLATQQAYIANLEHAIQSLPKKVKTPTTTTTTTVPLRTVSPPRSTKRKKKAVIVHPAGTKPASTQSHALAPGASASLTASSTANGDAGPSTSPQAVLVDLAQSTDTTTTASSTALPTLPTATPAGGTSATPTTAQLNLPNRTLIEENRVLSNALGNAIAAEQRLIAQGTPPTGLTVLSPARPTDAVKLNPNPPLLSNVFLRALLGLLLGLVLGVLVAWLLDGFDRRLRTSRRAEETFGLPVIAEVPGTREKSMSVIPVVDVVVDPYSPTSEAYRRLHVAVLTAPPVTWVRRGGGLGVLTEPLPSQQSEELLIGAPVSGGAPQETQTARLPVPMGSTALTLPRRGRFSVLVTSPTDEPTRSLVVVNLAAVFAEAGDRVLVATTGGMRAAPGRNGADIGAPGPLDDMTPSDLVANARPSQIPGVSSLALGQLFHNPSRLALNASGLVGAAREVVDVLLLEAPLLSTQDGVALMGAVDLVVVVCEAWRTTVKDGQQTQRLLAQHRPPVLGVVMTNMDADHPSLHAVG